MKRASKKPLFNHICPKDDSEYLNSFNDDFNGLCIHCSNYSCPEKQSLYTDGVGNSDDGAEQLQQSESNIIPEDFQMSDVIN